MAEIKQKLAASVSLTLTLASLANGSGRCSAAVDNSSLDLISADITLKIKTGASGVSSSGYLDVYLVRSEDGSNYDDSFAGSDAAFSPVNATQIGIISAVANATTYLAVLSTELAGNPPRKFAIAAVNNSGAALDSTEGNHAKTYTGKTYQTA